MRELKQGEFIEIDASNEHLLKELGFGDITLADLAADFDRLRQVIEYWEAHHEEFTTLYPDEYVAVHEGRVVAHSAHGRDLSESILAQGLDPMRVRRRFIAVTVPYFSL